MLGSGLPLDVIVSALIAHVAVVQVVTTVLASNVVRGTGLTAAPETSGDDRLVQRIAGSIGDFLVTRLSPGVAQLQVVKPSLGALHELLLADAPTGRDRGERTILIVRTETAGAVTTKGDRSEVLLVEGVVHLTKERHKAEALAEAFGQLAASTCTGPHIVGVQDGQVIALCRVHLIVHAVHLSTDHGIATMAAYLQVVGGNGVPHPAHGVLLLALDGRVDAHHLTVGNGEGEEALLLLSIVHTDGSADHEVLERRDAQVDIAEGAPLSIFVLLSIVDHAQRVLALRIGTESLGVLAVLSIDGEVGVELQRMLQHAAGSVNAHRAVHREVLADDHLAVEKLVVGIGTGRETAEAALLDRALIAVIADAEERVALLRAITD